jgi:hypothetical protein
VLAKVKLVGENVTAGAGAGVPVPERGAVCGEPVALSAMVIPAAKVIADAGVKLNVIPQLDPAATLPPVVLQVVETRLKSVGLAPVMLMLDNVSGALPEFMTMIVWVDEVDPTCVLAKVRLVGENVTAGAGAGVPVPETIAVCGEPVALSATLTVAVKVPVACGMKLTVTLQVDPASRVPEQLLLML